MANVQPRGGRGRGRDAGALPIDPGEWIGGRFSMPAYITGDAPYRPEALMWVSGDGILGMEVMQPGAGPSAVRDHLLATMRAPALGKARQPKRIRVATAELRDAIVGTGLPIDVVVGPTPVIDAMAENMLEFFQRGGARESAAIAGALDELTDDGDVQGPSYLEDGRISAAAVGTFFEAAGRLWDAAPWDIVPDDRDVLGVEIPSLGVKGKCLSIVGQAGESFGFILFESLQAQRAFLDAASRGSVRGFGCATLGVSFDREEDMPDRMLDELDEHGWPLPAHDRHPTIILLDADGVPRPATTADVAIATALSSALARFFRENRRWSATAASPVFGRYRVAEAGPDVEVLLLAPCPDPNDRRVATSTKKGAQGRAAAKKGTAKKRRKGAAGGTPQATSETALSRLAGELWGPEFVARFPDEIEDALDEICAAHPGAEDDEAHDARELIGRLGSLPYLWAQFWRPMQDGRTGAEVAAGWGKLAAPVLAAALERMRTARVVYGEIEALDPATSVATVRDLWDGASYRVAIPGVAESVTRWMRCFTVLVEIASGRWHHPSIFMATELLDSVTPADLLDDLRAALRRLEEPHDEVAADSDAGRAAMLRWVGVFGGAVHTRIEAALRERAAKPQPRRFCVTTDGECFEPHEAFATLPRSAQRVLFDALASHPAFMEDGDGNFSWIDRNATTECPDGEVLGSVQEKGRRVLLTSSSRERFERLVALLEALGGAPLELSAIKRVEPWADNPALASEDGPGVERVTVSAGVYLGAAAPNVHDLTRRMLAQQLEGEIPMLGGKPRDLVATAEGRAAIEGWLREAERRGVPPHDAGLRYLDLDPLRRQLGLLS